ncbi:MAG: TonB-dependent receptor plug domain-containing protein [Gammaproteobacteria bacterium]|nr:TonB-dependent receptor plug domain-containing protein [Gammaproteobacteria bacterium]
MHAPFRKKSALLGALIATMIHGVAVAEEIQLPGISVTAAPINQNLNTSVLTVEQLQSMAPATSDTASLLKNVPGLTIQKSGGVSGLPVLHGMADDRLRIKVDGMSLISACGNHMNSPLSYIAPSNVGSAVVHTALSPVSSGGDSIGGTILVDSPAPEFAKAGEDLLSKGEIGAFYRTNGYVRGGNISATVAGEKLSINYSGSTVKSHNYDAGDDFKPSGPSSIDVGAGNLDGDEVGSTFYKSTNQSISLALKHENHLVEFTYGEQDIPYQAWVNQRMDMTGNDSEQYNLGYEGKFDWGNLEARAYKERTRHKMQFDDDKQYYYKTGVPCDPIGTTCAAGMPMDTRGKNTGGVVKADIPLSARDTLVVGAELQEYRLDDWWDASGMGMWPDTFININNGKRDRTALFAEWEAQWNPQWFTQFGIRGEQVDMDAGEVQGYKSIYDGDADAFNTADRDITDHNIDLTAMAQFNMNDMTDIEFGYAQKTRSPNLYERYTWSTGGMAMRMINWAGDGNGYVGNLDLEPEISHTVSATFDLHDTTQSKWGIQVTPYYTYVDDYIDAERCSETTMAGGSMCNTANTTGSDKFVYLQFVNESAKIYGIDISGTLSLAEHTPYGNFSASALINYVRGKNEDTHDNLYNMMPLNGKFALTQSISNWTNTVELELVDKKDDVSKTRNELETSGYGLLNLRSSYEWKQIRIDVGIENALDKFYNDPLGGVYMGQGQTMSGTGVAWGLSAPGMGRSVYAGVNYKF